MDRERPSRGRLTRGMWQVVGLRETLVDVSDDEEASPSAFEADSSGSPVTRSTTILGGDMKTRQLRSLHPSSSQILMLCTFFIDNFDPVFKVLHIPTLRKSVLEASSNIDDISGDRSMEAFLFAMYCAAVTTLAPEDCLETFQEEKESLLAKYRHGAEMAFANADLFTSANMVLLQALVIFLVSPWKMFHALFFARSHGSESTLARRITKQSRRSPSVATTTHSSSGR